MRFKKYSIIAITTLSCSLGTIGCTDDLLETVPTDRVLDEFYWSGSDNDAKLAVNAAYQYLDEPERIFRRDAYSDIGHVNLFFSNDAFVEQSLDASSSVIADEWAVAYKGVAAANFVLDNIHKVVVTDANKKVVEQYIGEAKTLRAFQYIKLAAMFGNVPLVKKMISVEEARELTSAPVSEVWDFVDAELDSAANLLPTTHSAAEKGRITKGAALALKARANLYAGRMAEAATDAKKVMDLNVYDIYSQYKNLFTYAGENDLTNKEVILDRQYVKDILPNQVFAIMAPYSANGTTTPSPNQFVPTKALSDMYTMQNGKLITDVTSGFDPFNPYVGRDPRMAYTLYVPGAVLPDGKIFNPTPGSKTADEVGSTFYATSTGYTLKKYINAEDRNSKLNNGINIIQLRYAEVLLTYAEAKIEANDIDQSVADAINKVRQRGDVNLPEITLPIGQEELREIVRRERTIELAFEGHRLFDIRRWKIAETVVPGNVYGITYVSNGELKTVQVASFTKKFFAPRDYVWPVPQNERVLSPKLDKNGW
ncbi:RagB/SusD family nutrient uptake outer membrane protein [Chryseosolibacter indicus]|uniref:RagB/SusD family nutrient uptake outer membrane protein n=1 Tax=Chryseosolibacter indicus TaxID=2782351 RepID=A0ABS5VME9_9BACT|nr:RagB/SusD family nutrient uptake outer membrane protein [Chryseosolibacter indicus]MBT1701899.1 RagB/SusD family nutrient uptake outer membrane protein [Chryseosolibacter indicus]